MKNGSCIKNFHSQGLIEIDQAQAITWDIVIVGSGIGGSVAALTFAEAGLKVLVIEKGQLNLDSKKLPLWTEPVFDAGKNKSAMPFLGEGIGGSSRLFGMVMETLDESDFEAAGGAWPGSISEWLPWFKKAEATFSVRESFIDKNFDPLKNKFESKGLEFKPLRLATSGPLSDCQFCQSRLCLQGCKVDAWTGPLKKAVSTGNAFILTGVEVTSLVQHSGIVTHAKCNSAGHDFEIRGNKFVAAAGALKTPLLLLKSKNIQAGASFNDLTTTGHYLMRHLIDLYMLRWPEWKKLDDDQKIKLSQAKSWGSNTYYKKDGLKLGTIQSFGRIPDFDYVWEEMIENEMKYVHRIPFMKSIANKIVDSLFLSPIATSIIEDTATFENRVNLKAGGGVAINYQVSKVDVEKVQKMQKLLKDLFGPMLYRLEPQSTNNFRLAHVCGTCRMGEDPLTSVTDRFGKVHYSENLWIADASVFPSSTGKNPGLSIAAHSLRMANQMVLQESNLNVTRQA